MSIVSIVNQALTLLGADRIIAIDEDSENARKANAIYSLTRDEMLREHPWNFAVKQSLLSQLSTATTFDFDHAYQLPSDYLRILKVSDGSAAITDYKVKGNTIMTDDDTVYLEYIYKCDDTSLYDAQFTAALTAKLAFKLAFAVTNNMNIQQQMYKLYDEELSKAKATDGQESPDVEDIDKDTFINARS
jgi:hypothetical protein